MKVDAADDEIVLARDAQRLVELIPIDTKFGCLFAAVAELLVVSVSGTLGGVDPDADVASGACPTQMTDRADAVTVHQYAWVTGQQRGIVSRHPGCGIRDVLLTEASRERVAQLVRRAHIDPTESCRLHPGQQGGVAVRLDGVEDAEAGMDGAEDAVQALEVLLNPRSVVEERRGVHRPRQRLDILATEHQTVLGSIEIVPLPPLTLRCAGHMHSPMR